LLMAIGSFVIFGGNLLVYIPLVYGWINHIKTHWFSIYQVFV
jgi:hypothetical protein